MDYTHWCGPHMHWFWMVPFLFMILFFAFVAHRIRRAGGFGWAPGRRALWTPFGCCGPRHGPRTHWWAETSREILDRRYASGEITKEQYEQFKRDIESSQAQNGP